jgi:hypothetical protein
MLQDGPHLLDVHIKNIVAAQGREFAKRTRKLLLHDTAFWTRKPRTFERVVKAR